MYSYRTIGDTIEVYLLQSGQARPRVVVGVFHAVTGCNTYVHVRSSLEGMHAHVHVHVHACSRQPLKEKEERVALTHNKRRVTHLPSLLEWS